MRVIRYIILLFVALSPLSAFAQNSSVIDFNQESNVKVRDKMNPKGMIGVKYSYGISNANLSQAIDIASATMPLNLSISYTGYMNLWDIMPYFGFKIEGNYSHEGFNSYYLGNERYTVADLSIMSQFHIDFANRFRFLANIGPYAGYRLTINRDWDKFDNRFDYGLYGGIGFAIVFQPFEFHLEGTYKFGLSSYYHYNKVSYDIWLNAQPSIIRLSAGFYVHLF